MRLELKKAISKAVFIFGLLAWGWVCVSILDPVTTLAQFSSLSVYVPIPTDLVGIIGFVAAFFGLIEWESLR